MRRSTPRLPALLTAALLGCAACAPGSAALDGGTSPATSPVAGERATVRDVFLGDSYTAASALGGGYALDAAAQLGWAPPLLAAISGTGYVASGPSPGGAPYADRLDEVVAADPGVVVVQGSTNDTGAPPAAVGAAARELYASLADRLPRARVVVVGPLAPPGADPTAVREIRDALAGAAADAGLTFIDPIAEGWLTPPDGLFADLIHPNDAGYRQLADDLVTALRADGL